MKEKEIPLDRRGLMKLMREVSHNRSLYDVFRDFCEMAALAISNAVDKAQFYEREKRYFEVIKPYGVEDLALMARMLRCLVEELERVEFDDVLGKTFMELELANKDAGQFFTPYSVCQAMARMTLDDGLKEKIAAQGYVTANDPACGGGATLIAFAEAMRAADLNPQTQLHITAQDLDPRAVHMTYIQLSLLNIPAIVECRNTISMQLYSRWFTPAHILGGWNWKLRHPGDSAADKNALVAIALQPEAVPDIVLPNPGEQISLFAEPAP